MVSQLWVIGRAETCPAYLRITQDIPTSFTGTHSENINTEPRDGSKERHCLYRAGYPMPLPRGLMKIRREASSYCLTRWWMKLQLWILHTFWTQQTKVGWTLGSKSAANVSFLHLQIVLYCRFLQQWQAQVPEFVNQDLQIYDLLLQGPS